jgi:hypothetical protein
MSKEKTKSYSTGKRVQARRKAKDEGWREKAKVKRGTNNEGGAEEEERNVEVW